MADGGYFENLHDPNKPIQTGPVVQTLIRDIFYQTGSRLIMEPKDACLQPTWVKDRILPCICRDGIKIGNVKSETSNTYKKKKGFSTQQENIAAMLRSCSSIKRFDGETEYFKAKRVIIPCVGEGNVGDAVQLSVRNNTRTTTMAIITKIFCVIQPDSDKWCAGGSCRTGATTAR
jgi:hypothetical protein